MQKLEVFVGFFQRKQRFFIKTQEIHEENLEEIRIYAEFIAFLYDFAVSLESFLNFHVSNSCKIARRANFLDFLNI